MQASKSGFQARLGGENGPQVSHVHGNILGMSTSFNAAAAPLKGDQAENYVSFKSKYAVGKSEEELLSE